MSNLVVKEVNFHNDLLMAVHEEESNKIYVGVKWVCEGIGLSEGQYQNQTRKIQEDLVIKQGIANLQLPTNGGVQEVLCVELEFLPLWLAKISITPKMQKENPFIVRKLVDYQLKAKDVLADAFIKKDKVSNELLFLQGILDQMKENELKMKSIETLSTQTNDKVITLETEFNKETVTEGFKTNDNIARSFDIYSAKDKPHFGFIDAIAKHLRIYSTTIGYKDEYVNVIRTTVHGGNVGAAVYYSDKAIDLIREFVANEFKPKASYIVQGIRKGQIKEIAFQLNNKTYKFNESTYKKHSS